MGWVVLPILTFGSDDLLDPSRLSLLPLTRRQLMTLLGVGALVGVAPIATTVASVGLLPATAHSAVSGLVAAVAVILEVALCIIASRATVAALSRVLRSRRGRDVGVALAALVALSAQIINPLISVGERGGTRTLDNVAHALQFTPPGLLATAPGRPIGPAALSLLVVAVLIAGLIWWWERSLNRILVTPESSGGTRRRGTALVPRPFRPFLRPGRVGAIAAKDLRYLTREPKRLVAFVISVLLPVLIAITSSITFGHRPPSATVFVVCGVALLNGLGGANRFGMDGSASWMLISTHTRRGDSRRDVLGGDLASMLAATPAILVIGLAAAGVSGSARNLPAALGMAFALLATMVGASGLVSVLAPYPVPESRNAFGAGSTGQGCAAGLYLFIALGGCVVGCLPLLLLLVPSFFSPAFGFALLMVGPVYGLALGELLRRGAVRRWTDRAPEILQIVSAPVG